ncbi:MAG: hypothetical protein H7Y42_02110 [Chitinophagaceae bacterium]|nr:hypothetical protein [Chitinophagaceae bacterium]
MLIQKRFIRFTAICCFLSVITTLGIHLYFPDPPSEFEKRLLLFRDSTYILNRWWVIAHCLLVIVAMWGFALIQWKKSPGLTGLGYLGFVVFGIAEITRQMFVLFYMNEMREQYFLSADPTVRNSLRIGLETAGLLSSPLFGLFFLMFGLGNLCYGLSLLGEKGFSKVISVFLLTWGVTTLIAFGNIFWEFPVIARVIEVYNYSFQPLVRALIAIWLWRKSAR